MTLHFTLYFLCGAEFGCEKYTGENYTAGDIVVGFSECEGEGRCSDTDNFRTCLVEKLPLLSSPSSLVFLNCLTQFGRGVCNSVESVTACCTSCKNLPGTQSNDSLGMVAYNAWNVQITSGTFGCTSLTATNIFNLYQSNLGVCMILLPPSYQCSSSTFPPLIPLPDAAQCCDSTLNSPCVPTLSPPNYPSAMCTNSLYPLCDSTLANSTASCQPLPPIPPPSIPPPSTPFPPSSNGTECEVYFKGANNSVIEKAFQVCQSTTPGICTQIANNQLPLCLFLNIPTLTDFVDDGTRVECLAQYSGGVCNSSLAISQCCTRCTNQKQEEEDLSMGFQAVDIFTFLNQSSPTISCNQDQVSLIYEVYGKSGLCMALTGPNFTCNSLTLPTPSQLSQCCLSSCSSPCSSSTTFLQEGVVIQDVECTQSNCSRCNPFSLTCSNSTLPFSPQQLLPPQQEPQPPPEQAPQPPPEQGPQPESPPVTEFPIESPREEIPPVEESPFLPSPEQSPTEPPTQAPTPQQAPIPQQAPETQAPEEQAPQTQPPETETPTQPPETPIQPPETEAPTTIQPPQVPENKCCRKTTKRHHQEQE